MLKLSRLSIINLSVVLAIAITAGITFYSCRNNTNTTNTTAQALNGRALAIKYCQNCHSFASPAMADKKSWEKGILPAMALRLNLESYMGQVVVNPSSTVNLAQWNAIVKWYVTNAPDSLIIPKPKVTPLQDWACFSLVRPQGVSKAAVAMTTMLAVSPDDHKLYSGDAANNLYSWTASGKPTLVHTFESPVVGVDFVKRAEGNVGVFTTIGNMMPVDVLKGRVEELALNAGSKTNKVAAIVDSLPRPVQTVTADFNKDGLMDYVVCGFGHDRGALYYIEQQPGHKFKKNIVMGLPGGEQLIKGDFNNDGWTDVICLFAQADEGLRMFLNNKKGGFDEKTLLRFPPINGSSSFQLVDFNHDGKPDILYTCGDNSDYSRILKPYHGVYIFMNQGNWKFKQTYFYHIDGATKALAADFDGDGDLDIAAIAFFTDFKYHPEEGFTYLEQSKPGNYISHQIPVEKYGRWISMDVNDVDGDGKPDIILGNFSIGQRGLLNQKGFKPGWDMYEPLIVLKNQTKSR